MSQTRLQPMQEILRAIERAAPNPWHYREEAEREGLNLAGVEQVLELLHLEGLVTRGTSTASSGPGVVLTPKGEIVAGDPDAFARLGTGEPLETNDPGAIVRHSLRQAVRPTLTRLILGANFLVFAWCIYLAYKSGVAGEYLRGSLPGGRPALQTLLKINDVYHKSGGLTGTDIVHGEWWRLLTCCFVHAGLLHILMNMYALNGGGQFVEQTWGRWRFALIYVISCWGGSCLALAMQPVGLVGASGAVCGVFAAIGVWYFLNGKYLPRGMAQRGKSNIITNVILMVVISLVPGVSGYGHLGGALAGGLAAVALNFARFGSLPLRALAWSVLIAIPIASYLHLDHARKTSEPWRKLKANIEAPGGVIDKDAEFRSFNEDWVDRISKTMRFAMKDYETIVKDVREQNRERREEADLRAAVTALDKHLAPLEALADGLDKSGPYQDEEVVEIRANAITYARQSAEVFRDAKRCLEIGKEWTGADEKRFEEKEGKMQKSREEWEKRFRR